MTENDDMETIETTDDEMQQFSKKYEITWFEEIKVTAIFLVGLVVLCAVIFAILFFTKDITRTRGLLGRQKTIFTEAISSETCEANLKELTSTPHYAGTAEGEEMGRTISAKLRKLLEIDPKEIIRVYNETYEVLIPSPEAGNTLDYTQQGTGAKIEAKLEEEHIEPADPVEPVDPASKKASKEAPADPSYSYFKKSWIAYSGSANLINREIFYVNYGTAEDFAKISQTDLTGKIVIARYGKIFRGQKVKLAEERGAAGVILYSDPMEDGAVNGETYPNGPWRPDSSLQRGSAMYLAQQPGDPTTPGHASVPGTKRRIERAQATNLPKIPVIAISAKDAFEFLKNLDGAIVEESWKGGFTGEGFEYRYGTVANTWKCNMNIQMKEELKLIHNIFAEIKGSIEVDRKVMIGNHRDPWVYGATNPHSGTSVILEAVKGFGKMVATGWQPRRTIVVAFWDAEEQGLIGSTEFVEQYKTSLSNQLIAYINVDNYAGDVVRVMGSPALAEVARDATRDVDEPKAGNGTVFEQWKEMAGVEQPIPTYPGSGSDYTGFYHHLGISVLDLSFRLAHGKTYGAYHSIHDNFDYFSKFIDPKFKVCTALAKIAGFTVLKLAEEILLPISIKDQANSLKAEYTKLAESTEYTTAIAALTIAQQESVNATMSILKRTIYEYEESGSKAHSEHDKLLQLTDQSANYETRLRTYNDKVAYGERGFVSPGGLPGRGWYKNVIAAPGKDLGYGVEVFPAVREALRTQSAAARYTLIINAVSDLTEGIASSSSLISGEASDRNTNV